jgi:signal transduction histidine kinase
VAVLVEPFPDERFRLRVVDDGPGIAEGERARLVERRYRGEAARTRDTAGHGLGLNITAHVARVHGFVLSLLPSEPTGLTVDLEGKACQAPSETPRSGYLQG